MEFFRDAYSVRLMGHTGKYLWAADDRKSVAQKKGKDSYGVIWRVEIVPERSTIRLKSVYDLYLMASDYAFLLGATGKKVLQSFASKADSSLEWAPESAGTYVKLRTKGDKFLRANGSIPPYRNSITHDLPVLASNQNVVLWEVEIVRKRDAESLPPSRLVSPRVSNASRPNASPPPSASPPPPPQPQPQAESSDDDDSVPASANIPKQRTPRNSAPPKIDIPPTAAYSSSPSEPASPIASPPPRRRAAPAAQSPPPRRRGSPPSESVRNVPQRRRASPPHEAAYDESPPPRRRASPPREAAFDKSPPPRRRASDAEYDERPPPRRRASPSRDADYDQSPPPRRREPRESYDSAASEPRARPRQHHYDYDSSPEPSPARQSARPVDYKDSENSARSGSQKVKSPDIRRIFYSMAEDDGEVLAHDDESYGTFMFKGHGLEELTAELQRVTGIDEDIILCMRNPLSAKLYKMRLALPPNKAPLSIVIVRSNSQFGRTFSTQTSSRQR